MVGLAIQFDLGRYHGTPWGSHVNDAAVEWPPSPWRILRSLYAVAHTNLHAADRRPAIERALGLLVAAGPPSYSLPLTSAHHTRHFMPSLAYPLASQSKDNVAKVLDGFLAVHPEHELSVWWNADLGREERDGLESAVLALGYLGRSESVCTARVVLGNAHDAFDAMPLAESDDVPGGELVTVLCPARHEELSALTVSVAELRARRLRTPPGAEWVDYALRRRSPSPAATRAISSNPPTLACFRVRGGSRPSLRESVVVANLLRSALQSRFDSTNQGAKSSVFSGHVDGGYRTDQHLHAHYLALPDGEGRRIDHVAVWAPEGFGPREIMALESLEELRMHSLSEPLRLVLTVLGRAEELRIPTLVGPATTWRSLTPFGLTRYPKRRGGRIVDGPVDQIRRELGLRGFPEPRSVELIRGPWLEFKRNRPGQSRMGGARVVGASIVFPDEIRGPISLGALNHFGLGLFAPDG